MNTSAIFTDLGMINYQQAWDYQENLVQEIIRQKSEDKETEAYTQHILFCEHPHVYTLGKSGDANNLLVNVLKLRDIKAEFYHTNRGGDITYHGPGQIVGYPILDIYTMFKGVKRYIWLMEEAIIQSLLEYNIETSRLEGATGVWITGNGPVRKICAIGVRVTHGISMHGFALNVNTDLKYFHHINPCGFVDKGVTSIEKETGKKMDFGVVKSQVKKHLFSQFGLNEITG